MDDSLQEQVKSAPLEATSFPEDDPRWKLVKEVLNSRTFAKSGRLSSLLHYVCRLTLEGRTQEINEQQIGVHVFSRSPSYNSGDDSIVRTQARLLRQRLEEYFANENSDSSLIIRIPKGGYVPVFARRVMPQETEPPRPAEVSSPAPPPVVAAKPRRSIWFWVVFIVLFLPAVADLILRTTSNPRTTGAAHVLWTSVFEKDRPTVVVPSDDALVLFQELTRGQVSLDEYLSGSYLDKSSLPSSPVPLSAAWLNSHQYTSIADLNLSTRLQRVPEALRGNIETRFARDLRMEDLKSKNVVLIGGIGANPWVGVYENQLNFDVNYDWKASEGYVKNRNPKPGELAVYHENDADGKRHNYGVLAFLPGIDGKGNVLLFQGTGMAGTESATDFLLNEDLFNAFAKTIGATSEKVPHFEVLLETTSIGGSAPQAKVLAYRVLAF